ncbi:hypothetical protein QNI16_07155 [Cytophagaceae bacterium YF14B1]|uniref:Uncharacterized protein n=1 Tax=Xanthocytophaga flava TaxID=3048013 RepID=A0AAE3U5H0_9BACT|nr:hypothetical protein [Xanthocytophaga flavus]MDJ1480256.1 hypothetical protein [Xanthocytophaga flavus]
MDGKLLEQLPSMHSVHCYLKTLTQMHSKSIQESPENQIIMLETEAKMILKRVKRRMQFISEFPNHSLKDTYLFHVGEAMTLYGKITAYSDFLRHTLSQQETEVAA